MTQAKPAENKSLVLVELADAVLRSWWTVVAGLSVGLGAAVILIRLLPPVYEARADVFVRASKLPQGMLPTIVSEDLEIRLRELRDTVLSRPSLEAMVPDAAGGPVAAAELEAWIERIGRVDTSYSSRNQILQLRCRDAKAGRASRIANLVAHRFVEENARLRTQQSGEAIATLEHLTAESLREVELKEQDLAEFFALHPREAMPRQETDVDTLRTLQSSLRDNEGKQLEAQERLDMYRDGLAQEDSLGSVALPDAVTPSASGAPVSTDPRVATVREELKRLRIRYADGHPDVEAKERELAELLALHAAEPEAPAVPRAPGGAGAVNPRVTTWRAQIAQEEKELARLRKEESRLRGELSLYQGRVGQSPQVREELQGIKSKLDVARRKADDYQLKLATAREAHRIEEQKWGTTFEIIEEAKPPASPVFPDPLRFLGLGAAAGLALFLGPVILRRYLQPIVGSESGFAAVSEVPVLVSIPRIATPENLRRTRRSMRRNIGLAAASLLLLALAVVLAP